jgi:hypothetical protein
MFSLLNGVYDSYLAPTQLNLLVVGAPSVGKTTLLERLKVTQMPQRPSTKPTLTAEDLTPALQDAFVQGGAKASSPPPTTTTTDSRSPKKSTTPIKERKSATAVVVTQKRRFPLICPAPERYRPSAQDQEEDFITDGDGDDDGDDDNDDGNNEKVNLLPKDDNHSKEPEEEDIIRTALLEAPLSPVSPEAPRRVRCHSKEFNINHLNLMDDDVDGNRMSSMEDIPLQPEEEKEQKESSQEQATAEMDELLLRYYNPALLQSSREEYNAKPNAKMLPMSKIRPTSEYYGLCF